MWLMGCSANEVGVFIGLEIAEPKNDVFRIKRSGEHGDALCHPLDEEVPWAVVCRDEGLDLGPHLRLLVLELEQGPGVDADLTVDDELEPREPHPVVRQV